jgi:hypothetical protein
MQEGRLDRPGTHLPKHWQRHRQRRPHSDILARRRSAQHHLRPITALNIEPARPQLGGPAIAFTPLLAA